MFEGKAQKIIPGCITLEMPVRYSGKYVFFKYIFLKILFLCVCERERERDRERERGRQRHRQREKLAPCREPDMGLDPGAPGSHPGLKVVLNR